MQPEEQLDERYLRIPAQSQKQAMEWSLVLLSQEIHPIVSPPPEPSLAEPQSREMNWALLVEPADYTRALAAIRQYRLENRAWAWRRELPGSNLEIHSGAVIWCVFLGMWKWAETFISPGLKAAGRMDGEAVMQGDWWRLFTPLVLHSDLAHLVANVTFGIIILGLAMARFGWGITLLTTFLSGGLGNLPGIAFYSAPYYSVGASGMMMGALGLLCVHSAGLWRKSPRAARYILSGVIAGFLIFVLFGLDPQSDVLAHFGGFVGGLVLGGVLAFVPEKDLHRPSWNWIALGLVALAIMVTWFLALR